MHFTHFIQVVHHDNIHATWQVIKSKSAAGFVPNYAAGLSRSDDRSEPPIGAKVLLELYKKWQDQWIVELLFEDLLDWSDWFVRRRLLPPLGLVALGSKNGMHGERPPALGL